jgi:ElaB/YqjD/DUF883 family membrane-anchored ribosome-binding protein
MSERIPEGMSGDSPPDRGDFDSGQVHAHSPSATGAMSGSKTGVEESTSDVTRQAKDKTQEVARQAQEKADQGINQAAGGLETAAEKLREKTPDEGVVGQASEKVASGVESAAGYLRDRDSKQIVEDIENYAREHPAQAVGAALVAGFLIGRILR